ncbi:MAG: hypothetical protein WBL52_06145, partial [Bacillota bacterium]
MRKSKSWQQGKSTTYYQRRIAIIAVPMQRQLSGVIQSESVCPHAYQEGSEAAKQGLSEHAKEANQWLSQDR